MIPSCQRSQLPSTAVFASLVGVRRRYRSTHLVFSGSTLAVARTAPARTWHRLSPSFFACDALETVRFVARATCNISSPRVGRDPNAISPSTLSSTLNPSPSSLNPSQTLSICLPLSQSLPPSRSLSSPLFCLEAFRLAGEIPVRGSSEGEGEGPDPIASNPSLDVWISRDESEGNETMGGDRDLAVRARDGTTAMQAMERRRQAKGMRRRIQQARGIPIGSAGDVGNASETREQAPRRRTNRPTTRRRRRVSKSTSYACLRTPTTVQLDATDVGTIAKPHVARLGMARSDASDLPFHDQPCTSPTTDVRPRCERRKEPHEASSDTRPFRCTCGTNARSPSLGRGRRDVAPT